MPHASGPGSPAGSPYRGLGPLLDLFQVRAKTAQKANIQGGVMISFTLNGKPVSVDAAPSTPLLWVVRDHVGLTGTKYGCGAGLCGACTVHIGGSAVRACQTQMSEVTGKSVTTIEGLSPDSSHPLQK